MRHQFITYVSKRRPIMFNFATLTPRTLIAAGMNEKVNYSDIEKSLPDKYDFVGATRYSQHVNNIVDGLRREIVKQQSKPKPELKPEPKPEPKPESKPEPKPEPK